MWLEADDTSPAALAIGSETRLIALEAASRAATSPCEAVSVAASRIFHMGERSPELNLQ